MGGGSGSKSAKSTKSKSSKLKKSSKNPKIEGYNTYTNMTIRKKGSTSFLEPKVDNILAYNIADSVSISLEEAIVKCTNLCNEDDGKCTTFEVLERYPTDVPRYRCTLMNNNMNEFNPDTADFDNLAVPGITCVGTQGLTNPNFNQALFDNCANCYLTQAFQLPYCVSVVAGICGGVDDKGRVLNFFSDDVCGQACFSGKASNYKCLSKLQTYVLGVQGQAFINDPTLGPAFGCTTSNIFDPTTGEKFPDYTCPPNTNQPVPI